MPKSQTRMSQEISFLGRSYHIDRTVHRPRTSTEFITKAGYIAYINQLDHPTAIADIGVGGGVTAISCALDCPAITTVYGIDLYDEALAIAAHNASELQADTKLQLIQGDLLTPLLDKRLDVIVANLPFASTAKVEAVKQEMVELDEPLSGIHGGATGFELYEKMFDQLKGYSYIDQLIGIWIFCSTEHTEFVIRRHQRDFSEFALLAFEDKYKSHFSHFLLTRVGFNLEPAFTKED